MEADQENDILAYVRRSLDGDQRAFEWVVKKYQKRVYFTILQIVVSHEDADDVLQETFIKAYTKLHTFDASFPFYPWLYRIAINTALNYQKKKTRVRAVSLDGIDGNNHQSDFAQAAKQDGDMERSELIRKLKEALEKIPGEQRTVFALRVYDGLSYQEISATLDISIGTVMSRLSRAREKLRKLLEGYYETKDIEV